MSLAEILEELPKLSPDEQSLIRRRIDELTPEEVSLETLAAIDAGRQSMRKGKTHTIEEARDLLAQWTTRSS